MDAFYIAREGVEYGPFTEAKIKELILGYQLIDTDMVWFAGQTAWKPAAEVLGAWLAVMKPPPLPAMTPPPLTQPAMAVAATKQSSFAPSGQRGAVAATNTASNPWAKHVGSLKNVVGADKLIDPTRVSDSLKQAFASSENYQTQMSDVDHEEYDDPEPDEEDDEN